MDAILNNPYRILGLPTTATDKEIAKRVSDLLIYTEMGKKLSYETDFLFLGELNRSVEAIKLAAKKIELPENKIFYSLLCFDLNDSFEKESIELIKQENYEEAINFLKKEIFNICPIVYRPGGNSNYILRNFKKSFQSGYAITVGPIKDLAESLHSKIFNDYFIQIYNNLDVIEIQETYAEIDLKDKFQVACKFKWIETETQDESIGIGIKDVTNTTYSVFLSKKGTISIANSINLENKGNIENVIVSDKESIYIVLQCYDNFVVVRINDKTVLKIEIHESLFSTFLCFSGKQKVLIQDFSISKIMHYQILGSDEEINENTFTYLKNISLIMLVKILKSGKVSSHLLGYFSIVGNFIKQPYFISYSKKIISNNYKVNFEALFDIFINEFYLSLYHLIDANQEHSTLLFYYPFTKLSDNSKVIIIEKLKGSKPYIFENLIKDITQKRIEQPDKSNEFAVELKNEATYFFKWFSDFYNYGNIESKTLSDKVGNEILECSVAYYNSISPKSNDRAKQSLKLLIWASDFAFNQVLRDRINNNISVLIKAHKITEYNIIDFDLKDKTRLTSHVIKKDESTQNNPTDKFLQNTNTTYSRQTENKTNGKTDHEQNQRKSSKKLNLKNDLGILSIMLLIPVLFVLFSPDKKKIVLSESNQIENSKAIPNNNKSYLVPKEESRWAGNSLQNGSSPYDGIFGEGIYDYDSECWIAFKNENSTDAIVCLENVSNGRTIRNEYIQAGTDYQMTNIPEGVYMLKVCYGNDWNPEKRMEDGTIYGAFETDQSYSLADDQDDLIRIEITETNNGKSYTTTKITLYTVGSGNMNQRNIYSEEFF